MTSHEWAAAIRKQAAYMESKPSFDMPKYTGEPKPLWYMWDKDGFLAAVRALGAGKKEIGKEYVEFHPTDAPISVKVERDTLCRLVRPAEYDCEPFLKDGELEQAIVEGAATKETTDVNTR